MLHKLEAGSSQERTLAPIELQIRALFKSDAQRLSRIAIDIPLVVVAGPNGNGKTTALLPMIQRAILTHGVDVIRASDADEVTSDRTFNQLAAHMVPVSKGVLLLDECYNLVTGGNNKVQRLLTSAKNNGWHVMAIHPYNINKSTEGLMQAHPWIEKGQELGLQPHLEILPRFFLPRKYVAEYLRFWAHNNSTNPEAVTWTLENIPYNLRILKLLSGQIHRPMNEYFRHVYAQYYRYVEHLLPEEVDKIYARLHTAQI